MNAEVRRARKRPVEIEYMVWPGGAESTTPVIDWILSGGGTARYHEKEVRPYNGAAPMGPITTPEHIAIDTLEGVMMAVPGDVIIRGMVGEFYPCKPNVFYETYLPSSAQAAEDRLIAIATLVADTAVEELSGVTGILLGERMTWTDQGVHAAVWNAVRHNEKIHQEIGVNA